MQPHNLISIEETTTLFQVMQYLEADLNAASLLSVTDQQMLGEVFTRVVRKLSKDYPDLKLAAKWELRASTSTSI